MNQQQANPVKPEEALQLIKQVIDASIAKGIHPNLEQVVAVANAYNCITTELINSASIIKKHEELIATLQKQLEDKKEK